MKTADFLLSVGTACADTLQTISKDFGIILILVGAPVLYGFFYPWPYANQVVTRAPVAVVDLDHSNLSRQITRFAQANPRIEVKEVMGNEQAAQHALWRGEIVGYAVLPRDLKRNVVRGAAAAVTVEANGAYALLNKAVLYGFAEAVGTVAAGVEIRKLQAKGQSKLQAFSSRSPINLQMMALFNPTEGYGDYVVPAVALIILQQTLLMGAAMLSGTLSEKGRLRAGVAVWIGRVLALSCIGWLCGLFYFGWVFLLGGFPRGANSHGALLLLAFYVPCICLCGLALGRWFANRERALQVLLFTALPMAFLSGFSWPAEAMPQVLQWARWVLPSTSGVQAALRLNQMGASVIDVIPMLVALALLGMLAALSLALSFERKPESLR